MPIDCIIFVTIGEKYTVINAQADMTDSKVIVIEGNNLITEIIMVLLCRKRREIIKKIFQRSRCRSRGIK